MPPLFAGSKATAAALNSFYAPLAVIKAADQSCFSSTTLLNDNALVVPVVASAAYIFDFYLDWESVSGAGNGIKYQWTVPAGAALRFGPDYDNASGNVQAALTFTDSQLVITSGGGAAVLQSTKGHGSLVMGATAGNLQLQWAQNVSSATPGIVHAQSYMRLWRIT